MHWLPPNITSVQFYFKMQMQSQKRALSSLIYLMAQLIRLLLEATVKQQVFIRGWLSIFVLLFISIKDIFLGQGKATLGLSKETRVKLPSKILLCQKQSTEQAAWISVLVKTKKESKEAKCFIRRIGSFSTQLAVNKGTLTTHESQISNYATGLVPGKALQASC